MGRPKEFSAEELPYYLTNKKFIWVSYFTGIAVQDPDNLEPGDNATPKRERKNQT